MRVKAVLFVLLALGPILVADGCGLSGDLVDGTPVSPGFMMSDNLMGTVLKGAEVGRKITLVGLQSAKPEVVFETGTFPLTKMQEDDESMILMQLTAGSIDLFVLDKKSGRFARVTAGNYGILNGTVAASASLGIFK